ncbi:rRNA maturation RNase YbeY [Fervidibacter sacchari]|mgnify:FL=1|uniref:Endoribonuclease YbeY n=1 Tax=Candidatus Fervidibacter sacchari TaxID=1448929 RepID=A0ABT2EL60_9BACT|nr:rRNA maturation RNase YbeY [Candidatus Fervidibacter sacchari]MCS3918682.1 putative rRNA maturation factor [Candidatus Fervidibacter sacchari]WKU17562.1 rRNA maturation RNase YbeY [Candidatus Fervidibacter sacchari]
MVLDGEGVKEPATIDIVLCDDPTIQELNKRFLNHDYPTDVLSFLLSGSQGMCGVEQRLVGEIIISVETAERNSKRFRQTLESEILRLAIHGTLHLLGYDDETYSQRRTMRRKERQYLKLVRVDE